MDIISTQINFDKVEVRYENDVYRLMFGKSFSRTSIHMTPDEFHKFVSACLETQEIEINQVIKRSERLLEEISDLKWKE